jgi:hypothetical protein
VEATLAPAVVVAQALFAFLAVWLVVRASLHALVGLSGAMREETLNGERLAVAALSGALLAMATATALGAGALIFRLLLG